MEWIVLILVLHPIPVCGEGFSLRKCVLLAQSSPTLCDSITVAQQAPLSVGFSRPEYWSGLPFSSTVPYTTRKEFNGYQLDALI